jgi:hypothetical protein
MKNNTKALFIIGMHRSGTSALTGALQTVGVDLGGKLYGGHKGINDKGYFEHEGIADTNDVALAAMGSCWDDVLPKPDGWWKGENLAPYTDKIRKYLRNDFAKSPLWAVKDPRVCRLLPWWAGVMLEENIAPGYVFIVRSPASVSRSLQRRDGFSEEKSSLLWALHYLEAERFSRNAKRTFVDFDRFLETPYETLRSIENNLGITFPTPIEKAKPVLDRFLSSDLRHHKEGVTMGTSDIANLAKDIHNELLRKATLSSFGKTSVDHEAMDALWERMARIQQGFPSVLTEHIRHLGARRGALQIPMTRLMRSWSWVAGKPIRAMERFFGRDV